MRLVDHAQKFISDSISKGSICIDLTCGNGLDTLFLCEITGESGKVYSFDLQQEAVGITKTLISRTQRIASCEITQACHSQFSSHIPFSCKENVSAVMMNLGYLPGGDHQTTTTPEITEKALESAYEWLRPDGVLSVIAYRGHPGGKLEDSAVQKLINKNQWSCRIEFGNKKETSPILYMIRKM